MTIGFHYLARILGLVVFLGCAVFATAADEQRENIALYKPYTMKPAPNYDLTSDAGDVTQLTDGQYVFGDLQSPMWMSAEAVGWSRWEVCDPAEVTIDLGESMSIGAVACRVAAGKSGVAFPRLIYILVSKDGHDYYRVAELVSGTAPEVLTSVDQYAEVKFQSELATSGRYVRIILAAVPGPFLFMDEIEVRRGDDEFLSLPYPENKGFTPTHEELRTNGARLRLKYDAAAIEDLINAGTLPETSQADFAARLIKLTKEIPTFEPQLRADGSFRAVMPLGKLHTRLFALLAEVRRAAGYEPISIWHNFRYDPLLLTTVPNGEPAKLNVKMLDNDRRGDVINVTNFSGRVLPIRFRLSQLPLTVAVYRLEDLDAADLRRGMILPLTELIPDGEGFYHTEVVDGTTGQLWFEFRSDHNVGSWSGAVDLIASTRKYTIPLQIEVGRRRLPEIPTLTTGLWDYLAIDLGTSTAANRPSALADMKEHLVTTTMGHRALAALPDASGVAADGSLLQEPDFTAFGEWTRLWPEAKYYQLFLSVRTHDGIAGLQFDTPEFRHAVTEWAAALERYLTANKYRSGQVQINIIDEPQTIEQYRTLLAWAQAIKAGSLSTDIWVNVLKVFDDPVVTEALKQCDIICPHANFLSDAANAAIVAQWREQGKTLQVYCFDGRNQGPEYHLMQAYLCFANGGTGSHFWSYFDNVAADMWNEYVCSIGGAAFGISCVSPTGVTPTKRTKALAEGIRDYEYLQMLPNRAEAQKLAAQAWTEVSVSGSVGNPDTPSPLYKLEAVRARILAELAAEPHSETGK